MKFVFRNYQLEMFKHGKQHPYAGLFAEMGLGKTAVTLALINYYMYRDCSVNKTLVIAPLNVAESVWEDEIDKWDNFGHLKTVKVLGSQKKRLDALRCKADVYIINVDNVAWLVDQYGTRWPFDMVVIDELSCFKSSKSTRFRRLKTVRPFMDRVVGLTGTPMSNGFADLWSQLYLLDMGERLGPTKEAYEKNYLFPEKVGEHGVRKWGITEMNEKRVTKMIGDICISLKEKDWVSLPPIIYQDHRVKLSPKHRKQYETFEKTQVLKFFEEHEDKTITAANLGVLTNKLIQFAGGSVYDEDREIINVHNAKLDVIAEIIENANGKPVLIAYQYKHQLYKMQKRFGGHLFKKGDVKAWNEKKFKIMYLHPKSGGHGLNLQAGGNILIWFSPTWSLEQWLQLNKRLHRSGQKKTVIVHRVITMGTMDVDCIRSTGKKEKRQDGMMKAIKMRFNKYKTAA